MSFILSITGTIGNILNCLIFARRSLRQNSCSRYFFATSIANLLAVGFGCLIRVFSYFNINPPPSQLPPYCKIRQYLTIIGLSSSTWFIVGACADRYASSSLSARVRSFSQVKIAHRVIGVTTIITCIVWSQLPICLNTNFVGINCSSSIPLCNSFNNFSLLIFYSLLPPISMFILGLMTIRHVNNERIRQIITRRDRQLTVLLIVQVLCFIILSLPLAIQRIYNQFTMYQVKSQERIQLETLFSTLFSFLILTNSATSFYLFTLTSKLFRKELKALLFFSRQRVGIAPIQIPMNTRRSGVE